MGEVFSVEPARDGDRFVMENRYTGEKTVVEVSPVMQELYSSGETVPDWQDPCPFLRYDAGRKKAFCTVHETRPGICRDYGCWRILVVNGSGERVGRIMGWRYLHTDDQHLAQVWEEFRNGIDSLPDPDWDNAVARFFREQGYSVYL
jgi:Fe-S-cluster containining protein